MACNFFDATIFDFQINKFSLSQIAAGILYLMLLIFFEQSDIDY